MMTTIIDTTPGTVRVVHAFSPNPDDSAAELRREIRFLAKCLAETRSNLRTVRAKLKSIPAPKFQMHSVPYGFGEFRDRMLVVPGTLSEVRSAYRKERRRMMRTERNLIELLGKTVAQRTEQRKLARNKQG